MPARARRLRSEARGAVSPQTVLVWADCCLAVGVHAWLLATHKRTPAVVAAAILLRAAACCLLVGS
jgi:hypothetical protein